MSPFFQWIGNLASIATVVVTVSGAVWYFVELEVRLNEFEGRLTALSIAPVLEVAESSDGAEDVRYIENPILSRCSDLAGRLGAMHEAGQIVGARDLEGLMDRLGCFQEPE